MPVIQQFRLAGLSKKTVNRSPLMGASGFGAICTAVCYHCDNSTACRMCCLGSSPHHLLHFYNITILFLLYLTSVLNCLWDEYLHYQYILYSIIYHHHKSNLLEPNYYLNSCMNCLHSSVQVSMPFAYTLI